MRRLTISEETQTFRNSEVAKTAGSMEWQGALPNLHGLYPNSSLHFVAFPTANTFNPYRPGYGYTLPEQMQHSISQINAQLLYNTHLANGLANGSLTFSGSHPLQNQSERENQHFLSAQNTSESTRTSGTAQSRSRI